MLENNALDNLKSVAFRITDLCNLNCNMCGQAQYYESVLDKSEHYIELAKLKDIIEPLKKYKPQIYIWGGEPLLYPELAGFLEYLTLNQLNSFITTNGVLLDRFVKPLVDLKVTEIAVSLDGPRELHERIRGKKGIFDKIVNNLKLLKEHKAVCQKVFPLVDIHIVIVKDNYKEIYNFVRYLNQEGFCRRIRIQLPMFFTKDMAESFKSYVETNFNSSHPNSWYGFVGDYSEIDLEVLWEQIKRIKREYKNIIFFPADVDVDEWFLKPEKAFREKCLTCQQRINVEPNGDVVACTDFPETVYGNLLDEPAELIFNNSIINKHRQNVSACLQGICPRCSYLYVY